MKFSPGLAFAFMLLFQLAQAAPAQCPAGDSLEPNESCATRSLGFPNPSSGLTVTQASEDYYGFTLNSGEQLNVSLFFDQASGNIDAELLDAADCTSVLRSGTATASNKALSYSNLTNATQEVVLRVYLAAGSSQSCNTYSLSSFVAPAPCAQLAADFAEDNDICTQAFPLTASPATGLSINRWDSDFYTILVPANRRLEVSVLFSHVELDLDARLLNISDCSSILATAASLDDNEFLTWDNTTASAMPVALEIITGPAGSSDCTLYDLAWMNVSSSCAQPADSFEDNDDCLSASFINAGTYPNLIVSKQALDPDWYELVLPAGANLTLDLTFDHSEADIDVRLYAACAGLELETSTSTSDNEFLFYDNMNGFPEVLYLEVYVWQGSPGECGEYEMTLTLQQGMLPNLAPFCFGDGSGTNCPCNNNSAAGHPGGCSHSAGNGAVLTAGGDPSVSLETMQLTLTSAVPNTFGLLVSGQNTLPQMGGCLGCGLPVFDGLRCAGGSFLRHGIRVTDAFGNVTSPWSSLAGSNGFQIGQVRYFFAFYRTSPSSGCGTGQNSSNGVRVEFLP